MPRPIEGGRGFASDVDPLRRHQTWLSSGCALRDEESPEIGGWFLCIRKSMIAETEVDPDMNTYSETFRKFT
jgi:hypothetical protein